MIVINNKKIEGKVILAPMAGITSSGYRKFMSKFGISLLYTEMISDMGLIYGNQETLDYLNYEKLDAPLGVQLFGSDVDNLVKAAKIVKEKAPFVDFIDINMACPVNKVIKTGAGSSLLKDPKKCGEIVRRIREETSLPVSAKIRLGISDKNLNFQEVIDELIKGGVSFIALHARSAKQLYSGLPQFDVIKDLQERMSVPLIISGNIYTYEDAIKAMEITKAEYVMVARGGIGNPTLIKQINEYLSLGRVISTTSFKQQVNFCLELARDLIEEKGEERAMRIFRGIGTKFFNGFPNTKRLKNRICTELTDYNSLVNIIQDYKNSGF